jgi:hypothetical protein
VAKRVARRVTEVTMPAKSEPQRKLMGFALSVKRGTAKSAPASIKKLAKSMTEKELSKYASKKKSSPKRGK